MRCRTHLIWAAVVSACLTANANAAGREDAEGLIREGITLRRAGDDAGALAFFERAHQIARSARSAAQLGLCLQALNRYIEAEEHLGEALKDRGDPWIKRHRAVLEESMATVKEHLGRIQVTVRPDGADVEIDGRTVGKAPLPGPVRVLAGDVDIRVSAPAHQPMRRAVRVEAAQLAKVTLELEASQSPKSAQTAASEDVQSQRAAPLPQASVSAAPSVRAWRRPAAWATGAAAALFAGAGVYAAISANAGYRKFNDYRGTDLPSGQCNKAAPLAGGSRCASLLADADRAKGLAVVTFVGAALSGASSVLLFATQPPPASTIALSCGPAVGHWGAVCAATF